jgi:acetyl-CoA synthetase
MNEIDALLHENRKFPPPDSFRKNAHVSRSVDLRSSERGPRGLLGGACEHSRVVQTVDKSPRLDAAARKVVRRRKLNVSVNCVDRHIKTARRNKAALIWEGEPGDRRTLTYWDLYVEVQRFANVLKKLGVKRGDRVAIYMPLIPEVVIAMLACTRIGAAHSVVFGGFSPDSLSDRINDAKCKVLITADGGYRRGAIVPLKRNADKAIENCPTIEHVVVVQRRPGSAGDEAFADMKEGRDHWWHRLMHDVAADCEPEKMDAEDVLYISTPRAQQGKPKGIVHTTGGYLTPSPRLRSSSLISRTTTSFGAPRTSAGSPDIRISSMDRSPTARRA